MKYFFTALSTLLFFTSSLQAQQTYTVDTKNSTVYYKALADVFFFIDNSILSINQSVQGKIQVEDNRLINGEIIINIKDFDSQNGMRDDDVMSIVGYEINPNITFRIHNTEVIKGQLFLVGTLEVNSVIKTITVAVIKTYINDSITYEGKLKVKYIDFEIAPPTLGGFIKKAKESIEIGAKIRFVKTK
ncbi:YceI family protein [Sulfurimonas sp. SAG-AH-194-C20]|nr:YceI family protein [Sulfurimonas sp. SAG-AH-194-C20]MDF1878154.1 YceI family protein [Sulfurimonas sp. SAG-AH-194-C20]